MKILHRGTPNGDRPHTATCTSCGTKIEFTESEAKYVADQRDGDFLCLPCPVCFKLITKAIP